MGDEEKRARLFLNDLERIVIRYKPLLDLASEDGRERTYKDFYSLLVDTLRVMLFKQQIGSLKALKEEGKVKAVGRGCWGLIDGGLD